MFEFISLFTTATYITIAVEFGLGSAFGYFLGKLVKAMIALLVLGFIGVMINYTQFVVLSDAVIQNLGVSSSQFISVVSTVLLFLSLTVIAPLTVGLILGFLVGR